jgi:hypothetical protein
MSSNALDTIAEHYYAQGQAQAIEAAGLTKEAKASGLKRLLQGLGLGAGAAGGGGLYALRQAEGRLAAGQQKANETLARVQRTAAAEKAQAAEALAAEQASGARALEAAQARAATALEAAQARAAQASEASAREISELRRGLMDKLTLSQNETANAIAQGARDAANARSEALLEGATSAFRNQREFGNLLRERAGNLLSRGSGELEAFSPLTPSFRSLGDLVTRTPQEVATIERLASIARANARGEALNRGRIYLGNLAGEARDSIANAGRNVAEFAGRAAEASPPMSEVLQRAAISPHNPFL